MQITPNKDNGKNGTETKPQITCSQDNNNNDDDDNEREPQISQITQIQATATTAR